MVAAPPGYQAQANGTDTVFLPLAPAPSAPVLGLTQPAPGETAPDPAGLLPVVLPGWQPAGAWSRTTVGSTGTGSRFRSWQADVRGPAGAEPDVLGVLLLVLAAGGRWRLLWALGNPAQAVLEGEPLLRVLYEAAAEFPPGEPPDLLGTWRDSNSAGGAQYRFAADGSVRYELAAVTSLGLGESRTGITRAGEYRLEAGELRIRSGDPEQRFAVRVFDDSGYGALAPMHLLGLLPVDGGPELSYAFVEAEVTRT